MRGHVRERGKGNWYAVLSVRDPQTGKRKVRFHSLPDCKTKRDAQTACAKLLTETSSAPHISTSKTTLESGSDIGSRLAVPVASDARKSGNAQSNAIPNCCGVMFCQHWAIDHCSNFSQAKLITCMSGSLIKFHLEPRITFTSCSALASRQQCEQAKSPETRC